MRRKFCLISGSVGVLIFLLQVFFLTDLFFTNAENDDLTTLTPSLSTDYNEKENFPAHESAQFPTPKSIIHEECAAIDTPSAPFAADSPPFPASVHPIEDGYVENDSTETTLNKLQNEASDIPPIFPPLLEDDNGPDGFGTGSAEEGLLPATGSLFSANSEIDDDESVGNSHLRSSSAVVPERYELPQINYASKECLAKVLYANEEAVNKGAVLDDRDNDFYLRNPCERAQNKFLIVQLCDYIRPTALEIANYEFFSSGPKHIRISVSELYPTFEWIVVAEFAAEETHDVQRFPISSPESYVKFLKVEFLTHYGTEHYCTLSFLRVFGISKVDRVNPKNPSSIEPGNVDDPLAISHFGNGGDDLSSIQLPPNLHHLLDCFQCSPTSTCQNTRNYASKECGANVLFANAEAVNKEGVLYDKDLDYYLRNPCENVPEKFLILRLCEGVQPTRLEIANYEYFSSGPKNVRLSVSKIYPATEWTVVGEFEAKNTREVQCFPILPIGSYVKFIKLELLSHYGSEYYCTLSFLRVYGISKVDEFEDDATNHSRRVNNNNHLEDEVYVLKWFIGLLLSVFAIFALNYFC